MTLYGLVLAGGQSTRMGQDKGLLDYHGQPHRFYLAEVLRSYCERVFISINAQQTPLQSEIYNYVVDAPAYADTGPIGAVLSAHITFPAASFLIVTCDLPFFDAACAQQLVSHRDEDAEATAFLNAAMGQPEPLVAIYERRLLQTLPDAFMGGARSLRRVLGRAKVTLLREFDARCIHSADSPEDYRAATSNERDLQ